MTDVVTYEFKVTGDAPPLTRKGGPGRKRSNPFDAAIKETYDAGFYVKNEDWPEGQWYTFRVHVDRLAKVEAQIRNAANYQQLGSNIRKGSKEKPASDGTVVVAFRGAPKDMTDKANGATNGSADNASADNDEDYQD